MDWGTPRGGGRGRHPRYFFGWNLCRLGAARVPSGIVQVAAGAEGWHIVAQDERDGCAAALFRIGIETGSASMRVARQHTPASVGRERTSRTGAQRIILPHHAEQTATLLTKGLCGRDKRRAGAARLHVSAPWCRSPVARRRDRRRGMAGAIGDETLFRGKGLSAAPLTRGRESAQ